MPFTPYHLGPGLFLKAALPRRFSLVTFGLTQVAIDIETLYHILRGDPPLHRALHSLAGATATGLVVAAGVIFARAAFRRRPSRNAPGMPAAVAGLAAEGSAVGALAGGLLGGASHPLLDGIMHADVRPFWPWATVNPLLGLIGLENLHLGCALAGLLGAAAFIWRWAAAR